MLPLNQVGRNTLPKMSNEPVGNLPRKVHVGPGSWSLLLFCLNWLGMSKDRSEGKR